MVSKPRFVGRRTELRRLDEIFGRVCGGESQAVLIAGEPGIGKTRLAEVFSEQARAAGARVTSGRAWDGGGAPPYWPVLEALRGLAETLDQDAVISAFSGHAESIAAVAPDLARRIPADTPRTARGHGRFELFSAISDVLQRVAATGPLVVLLDDLHAADSSSIALVRFICGRREAGRLLMLATYRNVDPRSGPESRLALAELSREATTMVLGGLDADDVADWLGEPDTPDGGSGAELVRRTAGNPLFIDRVLRAKRDTGKRFGEGGIVPSVELRSAIDSRFGALPDEARRVVEALAVVGRPAALSLLARVLERPFETLLGAVESGIDAGLLTEASGLGQYGFYHPLVQEVAYASLPPQLRLRLHDRVARALEDLYRTDASLHLPELARHALAAAPLGRGRDAVSLCHGAGRRAMELAAFEDAARNFADARAALAYLEAGSTPPVELASLLGDLGDAELAAGRLLAAREAFEKLAEVARRNADGEVLGRAALGFARTFEFGVLEPDRLRLLEEAALALEPHDSPALARVLARLAQELWMVAGAESRRAEIAERAVAIGERLADDEATAFALNAWLQSVWGPEHHGQRLAKVQALSRLADRSGHLERLLEAHRWKINVAVDHGEIDRAETAMHDYARVAEALRRRDYIANAMLRLAMLPQLRGDVPRALELAERTRDLQARAGDPQAQVVFDSRRVLLLEAGGPSPELLEVLPAMQAHVAARPRFLLYRAILLRGLLAAGKRIEAEGEWARVWQHELEDVSRDMMWLSTLALLVPACVALGDGPRAERLRAHLLPLAPLHAAIGASFSLGSAARYVGLLEEMLGRREDAIRHLEAALAHNQSMGARVQAEETARDLARLRDVAGESPLAVTAQAADVAPPIDRPSGRAVEASGEHATFRAEGAVWLVHYAGASTRIKTSIGLSYLRVLLERPGVEVHVFDLVDAVSGTSERRLERSAAEEPGMDARARAAYRGRLEELRGTLAEAESFADPTRAEAARAEIEAITEELARAFGLGGRARANASAAERARTSVTKALARALGAIAASAPELGSHLERSIRTGTFCCYDPEPRARMTWSF